jgi:hypothetical protein
MGNDDHVHNYENNGQTIDQWLSIPVVAKRTRLHGQEPAGEQESKFVKYNCKECAWEENAAIQEK